MKEWKVQVYNYDCPFLDYVCNNSTPYGEYRCRKTTYICNYKDCPIKAKEE